MRVILGVILVAIVLMLFGWMSFSSDSDSTSVTIETQKVVSDTEEFVEKTKDVVKKASDEVGESIEATVDEIQESRTTEDPVVDPQPVEPAPAE